jgi:superfamily I DNA/RNA helicase/Zn-dependent peptidase ImmA (M78 family)
LTPFLRARLAALEFRQSLFPGAASNGIPSSELISAATGESGEDFLVELANPDDESLGGADALLMRDFRVILIRNDVNQGEQAFLVSHELGHWKLHPEEHDGCHKVVDGTLSPEKADTFGAQKVEAYGARERAELQANIFAREFLLPREVAKALYLSGKSARDIAKELILPLELVRQQLLDGLLLPLPTVSEEKRTEPVQPTAEQKKAALSTKNVSLVVAGPGTGKTTTLLLRVQRLLAQGAKPSELLILTFSNRAARELVDRLQLLGIENVHDIWVGTFHSFGLDFLRKNFQHFGLQPNFGIADKLAQIGLLEDHIHDVELKAYSPLGDVLDWLKDVAKAIQRAKDELADPNAYSAAVEEDAYAVDEELLEKRRDIARLYLRYEVEKRRGGRLADLGDLIMLPAIALRDERSKFEASIGRFKHILVDEYQDVNRASAELIKALGANADSLWVVGDPRQAIYRFRGASMRNVVRFENDFPDYQQFALSQNRRSSEEVVRLFEHTGTQSHPLQSLLPLDTVDAVHGPSGTHPVRVVCSDAATMRHELVEHAKRLQLEGVPYREQVILSSTHQTCGEAADALNRSGIPALHLGDIFQRPEIKNLLTLLQLFLDRSGSGIVRLATLPDFALSDTDCTLLLTWLKEQRPPPLSWLAKPPAGLSGKALNMLERWRTIFQGLKSTDSPWDVICTLLLDRTTLLAPYLHGDDIVAVTRRLALWQFIYFLRVPDGSQVYQTVGTFISRLRRRLRIGDDHELRIPPPEAEVLDAVAVMTIHGSKGLEFEAVHLVDIDARHFRNSDDQELVPATLLESIGDDDFEGDTEGANKLYVALSRAKKHLLLYEDSFTKWDAACAPAVVAAAHLYRTKQGIRPTVIPPPAPAVPLPQAPVPKAVNIDQFVSYIVCPRKYYYEYVRQLSPSSGLPFSVQVESAVMAELFAPHGSTQEQLTKSPGVLEHVLAQIAEANSAAEPYLRAYAERLLANGRRWLGCKRSALPTPGQILLTELPVSLNPHQVLQVGNVTTLRFFRVRPMGQWSRHKNVLRWVNTTLSAALPGSSFVFEICALSNGEVTRVSPYTNVPSTMTGSARALQAGIFAPKTGTWDCPKCRHFLYCPA